MTTVNIPQNNDKNKITKKYPHRQSCVEHDVPWDREKVQEHVLD